MIYPWPAGYVVAYLLSWLVGMLVHTALMALVLVPIALAYRFVDENWPAQGPTL